MTDAQLISIMITLVAILLAAYVNRKGLDDMRDLLRAEIRTSSTEQKAETAAVQSGLKLEMISLRSDLTAALLRIENKLDSLAENVADHEQRLRKT